MAELNKLPEKFTFSDIEKTIDANIYNLYERKLKEIDESIVDELREGKVFRVSVSLPEVLKKQYMSNIIFEYIKRGFAVFTFIDIDDEEYIDIVFSPYIIKEFFKIYDTISDVIKRLKESDEESIKFRVMYGYRDWYSNILYLTEDAIRSIMKIESPTSYIQIEYNDTYNHNRDFEFTDDKLEMLVEFRAYKL